MNLKEILSGVIQNLKYVLKFLSLQNHVAIVLEYKFSIYLFNNEHQPAF